MLVTCTKMRDPQNFPVRNQFRKVRLSRSAKSLMKKISRHRNGTLRKKAKEQPLSAGSSQFVDHSQKTPSTRYWNSNLWDMTVLRFLGKSCKTSHWKFYTVSADPTVVLIVGSVKAQSALQHRFHIVTFFASFWQTIFWHMIISTVIRIPYCCTLAPLWELGGFAASTEIDAWEHVKLVNLFAQVIVFFIRYSVVVKLNGLTMLPNPFYC